MRREVRPLATADTEALQELLETIPDYAQRVTGAPPTPHDATDVLTELPPGHDPAAKLDLGMWEGPGLLAAVDLLQDHPSAGTVFIGLLAVRGDRRGGGIGRQLHDHVLARCRERRADRLRLAVVATNAADAAPFWSALGYRPTGEERPFTRGEVRTSLALWERPVS